MSFLHGSKSTQKTAGPTPINVVKTATIGLIGIAPTEYGKNVAIVVSGTRDAASFGDEVPGFGIPQALAAIFAQGAGQVVVVNVFDIATHTSQVTDEVKTPAAGKLKLAYAPIGTVTIKNNDGTASSLVNNTDYKIDSFGNFTALSANVVNGTPLKFSYKKLNAGAVNTSDLVGDYDGDTGVRTGMQCWDVVKGTLGYNPKVLIAPGYSSTDAVRTELLAKAAKFRGVALLDIAYGTTVANAISGRGIGGSYNTSDKRAIFCYPYLKAYDKASNSYEDRPYSQFFAGVIAAQDNENGFWYSPSNREIKGIKGLERNLSADLSDENSEVNQLNAAGIVSVFNAFGTGFRSWGNSNASFPTNSDPDHFICVHRTGDVIDDSLEAASLQFMDRPLSPATRDTIRESGNAFFRTLIQKGALVPGSQVVYDPNLNPADQLATGVLTMSENVMMYTPTELIVWERTTDINLLTKAFS